ncbi:PREDICTED: uncharacterized protein LOC101300799 isoform 2 [Fragaria vesca subsp. vesca]
MGTSIYSLQAPQLLAREVYGSTGPLQYKHISTVSLSFIRTLLASSSLLNFSLFSMVQLCNKFSLSRPRLDLAQGSRSWCSVELQGLDGIISGATIPLYKASRTCL